jgi:FkbM family methyltransferase
VIGNSQPFDRTGPVGGAANRPTEWFRNKVWSGAVKLRDGLKRVGLLGPLDGVLANVGPLLAPPPAKVVQVGMPLGLILNVPPRSPSFRNFAAGVYERDVTTLVMSIISRGMTVVDLGASIGYYSLLASRLAGSSGSVYAFEPDPNAYQFLLANIDENDCANVVPVNKAVSDRFGIVGFVRTEPERGFVRVDRSASETVDALPLDAFFAPLGWPPVHVVKMDIEGSEERAVLGMEELLHRNPGLQLIMELNTGSLLRNGTNVDQLGSTLQRLGFKSAYSIEQHRHVGVLTLIPSRAVHNVLLTTSSS